MESLMRELVADPAMAENGREEANEGSAPSGEGDEDEGFKTFKAAWEAALIERFSADLESAAGTADEGEKPGGETPGVYLVFISFNFLHCRRRRCRLNPTRSRIPPSLTWRPKRSRWRDRRRRKGIHGFPRDDDEPAYE